MAAGHVVKLFSPVHNYLKLIESRLCGDDKKAEAATFYGTVKIQVEVLFG
jgi:hypothetical protein